MSKGEAVPGSIDGGTLVASNAWPRRALMLAILVCLCVCFDGFDNLLLPPSLPLMSRSWNVEPSAFAGVFALNTVAYVVGSVIAGIVSDRQGRRVSLIGSVAIIGVGSILSSFSTDLVSLAATRAIVGVGIGGTLVSAFTAVPEFTPPRWRSLAVAATTFCEPIGGFLASMVCALFLSSYGWQILFFCGGVLPIVYAVVLAVWLTETPTFLATRPEYRQRLQLTLARLGISDDHELAKPRVMQRQPGVAALFTARYRRDTLLIWLSGFAWLVFLFMILSWLPALVAELGGSISLASSVLAVFSLGATVGAGLSVFIVRPLGTRRPLVVFGVMLTVLCGLLAWQAGQPGVEAATLLPLIGVAGFACAAGQSFLFVLIPHVYEPQLRGTGVGCALGIGRIGTVAGAYAGAFALKAGGRVFFELELVIALTAFVCAIAVRDQVAPMWQSSTVVGEDLVSLGKQ